ncbi:hypothetical protein KPH14_004844 [Odynerus spinipes]|uniref:calcium/calmodulin-dependent protein kinase n=1 Tax=Odynerus spinipes TaxID=1348599 RepID=A0AAD9RMX5_9HYME|nr:hypothetical protein KPH14_004844 [Odynerus spinipes]
MFVSLETIYDAVDEESPGSSSKKLTVSPSEAGKNVGLEIPLESKKESPVFSVVTSSRPEVFQSATTLEKREDSSKCRVGRTLRTSTSDILDPYGVQQERKDILGSPGSRIGNESIVERLSVPVEKISNDIEKGSGWCLERTSELQDQRWTGSSLNSDNARIPSSPEEIPDSDIIEVRKDSALFLEEAEGFNPREFARFSSSRFARPRRESSGYASNLGTFDEDRRNSSSVDVLQDLLKERRKSNAKRLNSRFGEEVFVVSSNTGNVLERMPTTELHRKLSSSGLEMPDIEEVKELVKDDATSIVSSLDEDAGQQSRNPALLSPNEPRLCERSIASSTVETTTRTIPSDPYDPTSLKEAISTLATKRDEDVRPSVIRSPCSNRSRESNERRTFESVREESRGGSSEESREENETEIKKNGEERLREIDRLDATKLLSRSTKIYRFLSTQSEDRVDDRLDIEVCPQDRRISLQITRQDENEPTDSVLKLSEKSSTVRAIDDKRKDGNLEQTSTTTIDAAAGPVRKLSSPGEVSGTHRLLADVAGVSVRPIYPYCPYSPYGSPQGSPRNRRRPLRESRRVSIDNTQGGLQLNQYRLLNNIGQGSYGIVKLAYNEEDETHYAMKILSKRKLMKKAGIFGRMAPGRKGSADPLAKVYREIALLKKLDHPNVVKLVEVLDDPDEDNLYLVFELVQKGEVLQIPTDKPLDEETARKNFRDVVMGIEYLHYQRIVHRDIKPSNLLVDSDGRIKIADLGVSAELRASGELLSGPAGTPAFAAPETTTPDAHYSGTPCDVWSMGVTLYSLVTGKVPWDGAGSIIGVQAAIRSEPLRFPEKPLLSEDLRDLIVRMLEKKPSERISLQRLKEHDWLTNGGKEPLPSEADNCRLQVTVTDEEVERVVTKVPKLDTLILVKKMLKQHSFQNPFLPKRIARTLGSDGDAATESSLPLERTTESLAQRGSTPRNVKSERFQRSGRSNSAPDSYDWQVNNRQISMESPLPPVTEASNQEAEIERR